MLIQISNSNCDDVKVSVVWWRALSLSLVGALILACGAMNVQAQDGDASRKGAKGETLIPISPVNTRTRSRRAASHSANVDAPAKAAGKQSAGAAAVSSVDAEKLEGESVDATAASKSAASRIELDDSMSPSSEANSAERVAALRAGVEEAATEQERARAQRALVDYLIAQKHDREAIAELRLMLREERLDPVGFYNIGNALARLGETPTAVDAYRKAIAQRHGNYSRALNNLGVVLMRQERWDEATEALNSALMQENFHYPEARRNLTRMAALRGRYDAALPVMQNQPKPKP